MINFIINITLLIMSISSAWLSYINLSGLFQLVGIFISGILLGCFLMSLKLIVKNKKLGSYQRQLEKESISSDENAAKVKVLESKIQVLEKALENALNK